MPLLPDQIDDLDNLTLRRFRKKQWVDISLPLQKYFFADRLKVQKSVEDGGTKLNWKVVVDNQGTFKDNELFGVDKTSRKDVTKEAEVEWSMQTVSYTYDINESIFQSDDEVTIVEQLAILIYGAYKDYYIGMEDRWWTTPTSSSQNPRKPFGIPHWLVKSSTAAYGLNGGNPTGFSSGAGGLSSTTYPQWANGTFTYNNITEEDALDTWSEAIDKSHFIAPRNFANLVSGLPDYSFCTTHSVLQDLRKHLKANNDDIGIDAMRYRGQVLVQGTPVEWVPALTNSDSAAVDTDDPIYGINWNTFAWFFQRNRNMNWSDPQIPDGQHTVRDRFMDCFGNTRCYDRRANFVGKKA